MYEPLKYPDDWPEPSRLELLLRWIPIAGWIAGGLMERARTEPIAEQLYSQLKARREEHTHRWQDQLRRRIANVLIDSCVEACGWPNSHFTPDDSFGVMIEARTGDGCEWDAMFRIEKSLGIKLTSDEQRSLIELTLGDAVETLASRLEAAVLRD